MPQSGHRLCPPSLEEVAGGAQGISVIHVGGGAAGWVVGGMCRLEVWAALAWRAPLLVLWSFAWSFWCGFEVNSWNADLCWHSMFMKWCDLNHSEPQSHWSPAGEAPMGELRYTPKVFCYPEHFWSSQWDDLHLLTKCYQFYELLSSSILSLRGEFDI